MQKLNTIARSSGFRRWLALSLAVTVTLIGGVLYGSYSHRWGPPADLVAAGTRLSELPTQIGSWKLVEELPMNDTALKMLECAGYVNRRYIDQESGQSISVAVIVGPPGPTSVHTPEICFSSRAYEVQGERQKVAIGESAGEQDTFWFVDFTTRNPFADSLRIYYAWSRGDRWQASASPRYEFAAEPLLYKIQLATTIAPGWPDDHSDPGRSFLKDLENHPWSITTEAQN